MTQGRYVDLLTSETNRYHVRLDLWAAGHFDALQVSLLSDGVLLVAENRPLRALWDELPRVVDELRAKPRMPMFLPAHFDPYATVTMTEVALLDAEYYVEVGLQNAKLNPLCSSHMQRVKALGNAARALKLIESRIPEQN